MSNSYFALCSQNGQMVVRRIPTDANLQATLDRLFADQESQFRASMQNEILFTGDWNPDEDEALYVEIPSQTNALDQTISGYPLAVQALDVARFEQQGVRAIFSGYVVNDGTTVVQIQKFSAQQILNRRAAMFFANNMLNELTDPAFTLDTKLVGIIEDGRLKFKSYYNIRMIFDLSEIYRAATDQDIDQFATHACLEVADIHSFKEEVDQTARKLIHAIQNNGTLDQHTAQQVQQRAESVELRVEILNGRVLMPDSRADIKRLLRFLHDDIYEAPLSGLRYVTNSKKPE